MELLLPDRSLWSGEAGMVIAKTIDGDIGILPGHAPVFGILSPGSLVRIREVRRPGRRGRRGPGGGQGRLPVGDRRPGVDPRLRGPLAADVDASAARSDLDSATAEAGSAAAAEESVEVRYARARLRRRPG